MEAPKSEYLYTETIVIKVVVNAASEDEADDNGVEYVGGLLNLQHRDMLFKQVAKRLGVVRVYVDSEHTQVTKLPPRS